MKHNTIDFGAVFFVIWIAVIIIAICIFVVIEVTQSKQSEVPQNCEQCSNYSCDGYIVESNIEESHEVVCKSYDIANVVNRYAYSGTIEGTETASGFLLWYDSDANISGSISEKETHKFYYKTPDGGYKNMSVPVESTTIYYTNEHPKIEIVTQYTRYWKCNVCGEENYEQKVDNLYKIYVPEGTIAEEYSIN